MFRNWVQLSLLSGTNVYSVETHLVKLESTQVFVCVRKNQGHLDSMSDTLLYSTQQLLDSRINTMKYWV